MILAQKWSKTVQNQRVAQRLGGARPKFSLRLGGPARGGQDFDLRFRGGQAPPAPPAGGASDNTGRGFLIKNLQTLKKSRRANLILIYDVIIVVFDVSAPQAENFGFFTSFLHSKIRFLKGF